MNEWVEVSIALNGIMKLEYTPHNDVLASFWLLAYSAAVRQSRIYVSCLVCIPYYPIREIRATLPG